MKKKGILITERALPLSRSLYNIVVDVLRDYGFRVVWLRNVVIGEKAGDAIAFVSKRGWDVYSKNFKSVFFIPEGLKGEELKDFLDKKISNWIWERR